MRDLQRVVIWNCTDCCSERLADAVVLVSESPLAGSELAAATADGRTWSRRLPGRANRETEVPVGQRGRYVRVMLEGRGYLSLAEVEVLATPPLCPVSVLTGLPCPGCGMARAVVALARGDVAAALAENAVGLPLFAGLLVALPVLVAGEHRLLRSRWLGLAVVAAWLAYHLARTAWWAVDGTLMSDHVGRSWRYWLSGQLGLLGQGRGASGGERGPSRPPGWPPVR